jgi:hypothetical protein
MRSHQAAPHVREKGSNGIGPVGEMTQGLVRKTIEHGPVAIGVVRSELESECLFPEVEEQFENGLGKIPQASFTVLKGCSRARLQMSDFIFDRWAGQKIECSLADFSLGVSAQSPEIFEIAGLGEAPGQELSTADLEPLRRVFHGNRAFSCRRAHSVQFRAIKVDKNVVLIPGLTRIPEKELDEALSGMTARESDTLLCEASLGGFRDITVLTHVKGFV